MACITKSAPSLTEEAVTACCSGGLTNYEVPKGIASVTDIPKSPIGKVLQREFREMVTEG